jgi:predicted permease
MLEALRLSARRLRTQPGFTVVAIAILGLGVGAATTIMSLVDALVLRSLPYPEPDRLVRIFRTSGKERQLGAHSLSSLRDYRAQNTTLEGLGVFGWEDPVLEQPGTPPEQVWGLGVNAEFFGVLGVRPLLGRLFVAEEEQPGRNRVAIISHRMWQSRFGGEPTAVGRSLRLDGDTVTVVGVMPPEFNHTPRFWGHTNIWRPLAQPPEQLNSRRVHWLSALARLKPGRTVAEADAELRAIAERLDTAQRTGDGVRVAPLRERESVDETGRVASLALALTLLLLAIACLNLSGLQLARLAARSHERAVRVALGASRLRLLREGLTETLLLGVAGSVSAAA